MKYSIGQKVIRDLKKGDIVKVWDDEFGISIRVFSHFASLGEVCTYNYNDSTQSWQHAEKISVDELKDFE